MMNGRGSGMKMESEPTRDGSIPISRSRRSFMPQLSKTSLSSAGMVVDDSMEPAHVTSRPLTLGGVVKVPQEVTKNSLVGTVTGNGSQRREIMLGDGTIPKAKHNPSIQLVRQESSSSLAPFVSAGPTEDAAMQSASGSAVGLADRADRSNKGSQQSFATATMENEQGEENLVFGDGGRNVMPGMKLQQRQPQPPIPRQYSRDLMAPHHFRAEDGFAGPTPGPFQLAAQPQGGPPAMTTGYNISELMNARAQPPPEFVPRQEYGTMENNYGDSMRNYLQSAYNPSSSMYEDDSCCCTLCHRIGKFLQSLATSESIQRSFCFGAIDGMLTGSGITAACVGLGFLSSSSSSLARLAVVSLSLACCTADGICMAIGHIWSTYVLQSAAMSERKQEMETFQDDPAESKAKLVDMLMSRGMLKLDAMTIADTLEGYPDIFVSALVGDASGSLGGLASADGGVYGEGGSFGRRNSSFGGSTRRRSSIGGIVTMGGAKSSRPTNGQENGNLGSDYEKSMLYGGGGGGGLESLGSYGQFAIFQSQRSLFGYEEEEPEHRGLKQAVSDGWSEGLVMMLSFCIFCVVPSSVYVSILLLRSPPPGSSFDGGYRGRYSYTEDDGMNDVTLSILVISFIMFLLGVWKSTFFASSWMVFAVETVLVLQVCILSAYFVGYGLSVSVIGLDFCFG